MGDATDDSGLDVDPGEARVPAGDADPRLGPGYWPPTAACSVLRETLTTLAAVVVLTMSPVVLGATAVVVLAGGETFAIGDGSVLFVVPTETITLSMWAGLLLSGAAVLYAVSTMLVAGVMVAAGALLSGPVALGRVLRRAAKRAWTMMSFLLVVPVVASPVLMLPRDSNHSPILAGVLACFLAPLTVGAGAISILTRSGPIRATGRMLFLMRIHHGAHVVYPAACVLVAVALGWALPKIGQLLQLPSVAKLALGSVLQAAVVTCAVTFFVTTVTVLVLRRHDPRCPDTGSEEPRRELDLETVRSHLPTGGSSESWFCGRLLFSGTAGVASVLLFPAVMWVHPTAVPTYGVQTLEVEGSRMVSNGGGSVRAVSGDEGLAIYGGEYSQTITWCSPVCSERLPGSYAASSEFVGAGISSGLAQVRWEGRRLLVSEPCNEEPYLDEDRDPCAGHGTVLRTDASAGSEDDFEPMVAAEAADDGPVVVSMTAIPDESGLDVQLHRCADSLCSDHQTVDLGTLPMFDESDIVDYRNQLAGGERPFDMAVRPDGSVVIGIYDPYSGATTVLSCSDPGCTDRSRQVVVPPSQDGASPAGNSDAKGVRVDVRPDGRPVLVHRHAPDNSIRLVDCSDTTCTRSNSRRLSDISEHPRSNARALPPASGGLDGWLLEVSEDDIALPLPDLAIDSDGRPQIVGLDANRKGLTLLSCQDNGCADIQTVGLRIDQNPSFLSTEFTLDAADRPIIALRSAPRPKDEEDSGDHEAPLMLLNCEQPRCGAP